MSEDPTLPIRERASQLAHVDAGTACTQTSFKTQGKAFLYIGPQGGRYKAMFKLSASRDQAQRLAGEHPDDFQIGTQHWVTARFSEEAPLPEALWMAWLEESYQLCQPKPKR